MGYREAVATVAGYMFEWPGRCDIGKIENKINDREKGMHTASSILEPASLPTLSPNFSALLPRGSFSRALSASTRGETSQQLSYETNKVI